MTDSYAAMGADEKDELVATTASRRAREQRTCQICHSCANCAIHAWIHRGGEDVHEDRTGITAADCEYRKDLE